MEYIGIQTDDYISHHGVKGMRWGHRKNYYDKKTEKISTPSHASKVTKTVISDHNKMSNAAFRKKYQVSKKAYAKRVSKMGGDPYKYRTNAQFNKDVKKANGKGKIAASIALATVAGIDIANASRHIGFSIGAKKPIDIVGTGMAVAEGVLAMWGAVKLGNNVRKKRKEFNKKYNTKHYINFNKMKNEG